MKKVLGSVLSFLIRLVLPVYFKLFGKLKIGSINLKGVKRPFFLVSNHQATMDPFLVGVLVPGPISFVATDMLFRVPIMNFLMSAIGSIPKSKFTIDSSAVRQMMRCVRNGRSVGIFPEGQRCFAGYTEPLVPGIGKLAKMLDVPVISAKLQGGYFADPFWALKKRHGGTTVNLGLLLSKEQLRAMDFSQVEDVIIKALVHSDYEWIKTKPGLTYKGKNKALGLHNIMFVCPECMATDCFLTSGDVATCKNCGYSVAWGDRGEFVPQDGTKLHYENLELQDRWQEAFIESKVSAAALEPEGALVYGPLEATIRRSRKAKPLKVIGEGLISLHNDAIRLVTEADCPKTFHLDSITGFAISAVRSKHNRMFEFIDRDGALYNIILHDPLESTYKWYLTVYRLRARIKAASSGSDLPIAVSATI